MTDIDWTMPVDAGILERLPKQGSRLGYHVLGATVRTILTSMNAELPPEARMTAGIVAQRIARWLAPRGLVVEVKVHGSGGSKGYQITPAGERVLAAMKKEESA